MIDIGVIGTGVMGENHVRILSTLKGVNSVYVFDKDTTKSRKMAEEYDCLASETLESLLDCVSAVTVVTPTKSHHEIALEVIERDINLLVEKPICKNTTESKELCEKAQAKQLINGVGHVERFNPIVGAIKKLIQKPSHVSIYRHNPASSRITDSNVVEDLMIHDIDVINYLFEFDSGEMSVASCGDDDSYSTLICNKYPIFLSASRKATKKTRTIYIEDERYTIEGDFIDQTVNIYHKADMYTQFAQSSVVGRLNLQRVEPLREELDLFVRCVNEKKGFPIPFVHGHFNLMVCENILKLNTKYNPVEDLT